MKSIIIKLALCAILFSCTKEKSEIMEFTSNTSNKPAVVNSKNIIFYPVYSLYNPCTQEYIDFKGSVYIKVGIVLDSVKAKYTVHINYQNMVGTGQKSGNIYRAMETFTWVYNVNKNSEVKYTEKCALKYICNNSTFMLLYDIKYTLSPEGVKSVILDNTSATCK